MSMRLVIADGQAAPRRQLQGFLVVAEAENGDDALLQTRRLRPDAVLLDDGLQQCDALSTAARIHADLLAAVFLIAGRLSPEHLRRAAAAGIVGSLQRPLRDRELLPSIEVATARWHRLHAQRRELQTLQRRVDVRADIDRAKSLLMGEQGLTEAEAFRRIQQLAMNSRRSMHDIAQAILITQY